MERRRLGLRSSSLRPVLLVFGSLLLSTWIGASCAGSVESKNAAPPAPPIAISDGWIAMGTFFEVELRVPESEVRSATEWVSEARTEISRLENRFSRHDPTSEVSALNRQLARLGRVEHGFVLSPELSKLLRDAQRLNIETHGAFDITIGPLLALWSEAARNRTPPSESALRKARASLLGADLLTNLSGEEESRSTAIRLDLDGLSKGAVLDRLGSDFRARFAGSAALFSFGQSSVLAIGDPDGQGWRLVLQSRDPRRGIIDRIRLRDQALSMSSSIARRDDRGATERDASYVVDPRTGRRVAGGVEAVVVSDSAMHADAWSTALLVLGEVSKTAEGPSQNSAAWPELQTLEWMRIDQVGHVDQSAGWAAASGSDRDSQTEDPARTRAD